MKDRSEVKKIANSRINNMFTLSNVCANKEPVLSKRYLILMEKIALRSDVTIPRRIKLLYCKNCKRLYKDNSRIRITAKTLKITCIACGDIRRIVLD